MTTIYHKNPETNAIELVSNDNPFPIKVSQSDYLPPVAGQLAKIRVPVPGVGTGSIYAAGDAFGTLITLHSVFRAVKGSGTLVGVVFHDLDDEGSQIDVHFFGAAMTTTDDNSAFTPTDNDNLLHIGAVSIVDFFNMGSNQVGVLRNLSLPLVTNKPDLYVRLVTQGTPTVAADAVPWITFYVVPN